MRLFRLLTVTLIVLIFAGCSGKTIQMYTLSVNNAPKARPVYSSIRVDYPKGIEDTMSTRIYFSRSKLTQSYYSYSQWSKPLSRILMSNLIESLQRSGLARTVLDYASEADAEYELETTVYRFEQKIEGERSYADISIGLRLLRSRSKTLVASKRFSYRIPCPTTDARGFVEAANRAMQQLSVDMVQWLKR